MSTTTIATPKTKVLRSEERGKTNFAWLKSYHSFSFGEYFDPEQMGFRSLRVINDDYIAPGGGFGMHPHRDMEILTFMVDGQIEHKDSMGNGRVIEAGELQWMSAGKGVLHSEFNPSNANPSHLLQIWIQPDARGLTPAYAEWKPQDRKGILTLLASPDGADNSIQIRQDARLYSGKTESEETLELPIGKERGAWVQVIRGQVEVLGETLGEGDAISVEDAEILSLRSSAGGEWLLFDLA
jgi:redox-sensitive bicupin YhaK (pirin superfamily)